MTEAYQKVHKIRGCGAVIKDIHPASSAVGDSKARGCDSSCRRKSAGYVWADGGFHAGLENHDE